MLILIAGWIVQPKLIVTVAAFAEAVSAELKCLIDVAAPLRKDLVFLERRGASASVALEAVAGALGASVRKTHSGYRIERTKYDVQRLHAERTSDRSKWIDTYLKHVSAFRKRSVGTGSAPAAYFAAFGQAAKEVELFSHGGLPTTLGRFFPSQILPSEILFEGLLRRIGSAAMADLPTGQTRVFSDSASNSTVPLPPHDDLLANYDDEMGKFRAAVPPPDALKAIKLLHQEQRIASLVAQSQINHLRLFEIAKENGILFRLEGLDGTGRPVLTDTFDVSPVDGRQTVKAILSEVNARKDVDRLVLSAVATDALRFSKGQGRQPLPDWFVHPDKQEPLNQFVGEAVSGLARKTPGKPVAVFVSDSLWSNVRECAIGDTLNLDALIESLKQWGPYDHLSRQDLEIWRPKDIELDEQRHADRKVLAQFVRDFTSNGTAGLRLVSNLYRDASTVPSQLAQTWLLSAQFSAGFELLASFTLETEFYRVLGAISESAWSKLVARQTLTIGEAGITDDVGQYLGRTATQRPGTDAITTPELWNSRISLQLTTTPLIRRWRGGSSREVGDGLTIDQFIALFRVPADSFTWSGDQVTAAMTQENFESGLVGLLFRHCEQERADVKVLLASGQEVTGQFFGNVVPKSVAITYADLPKSVRDVVWKHAYEAGLSNAVHMRIKSAAVGNSSGSSQPPPRLPS